MQSKGRTTHPNQILIQVRRKREAPLYTLSGEGMAGACGPTPEAQMHFLYGLLCSSVFSPFVPWTLAKTGRIRVQTARNRTVMINATSIQESLHAMARAKLWSIVSLASLPVLSILLLARPQLVATRALPSAKAIAKLGQDLCWDLWCGIFGLRSLL